MFGNQAETSFPLTITVTAVLPAGTYNFNVYGTAEFFDASGTFLGNGSLEFLGVFSSFFQPLV